VNNNVRQRLRVRRESGFSCSVYCHASSPLASDAPFPSESGPTCFLSAISKREQRWGRILNLASIVAYQPGAPNMAAYYASKAYVLSFSKGLARELHGTGVSVTALAPGPTDTSFDDTAHAASEVLYKSLPKLSAASVARAGYDGMKQQKMVVIPGLMTKLLALAGELPPRRIALEVNRMLWKPHPTRRGSLS